MDKKPTVLYFVRHGETDYNVVNRIQGQQNVPLNDNGMRQAQYAGNRLKNKHFDVIYSSDLDRTMVTAWHIADGREIIADERLREWHLGHWQGKLMSDIRVLYPEECRVLKDVAGSGPASGESVIQLRDRIAGFVREAVGKHSGKEILCVTHGGVMRAFLMYAMQFANYPNARVDNTAVCCFSTADDGESWQLVFWNDINHLAADESNCSGFVF